MEPKIYCLMWSGNPLTPQMCETLFVSALDMWDNGNCHQFLKAPKYEGVIESNFEIIDHLGEPAIYFEAMIASQEWEGTQVHFMVHLEALKEANKGIWEGMKEAVSNETSSTPTQRRRRYYNVTPSMN